jgi:hypothetical protein
MGKYIDGGVSPASFPWGVAACPDAQATAYDMIDPACWKIYGKGIVIGDTNDSNQAGFEVFNFNIHNDGTQPAVPFSGALEGAVLV